MLRLPFQYRCFNCLVQGSVGGIIVALIDADGFIDGAGGFVGLVIHQVELCGGSQAAGKQVVVLGLALQTSRYT